MEFVRPFETINKTDSGIAGGKGASLGEMTLAGIHVPQGFVVLSGSFDYFVEKNGIQSKISSILNEVKPDESSTIEHASQLIRSLIASYEIPSDLADEIKRYFDGLKLEYVAVRSSATAEDGKDHAWAGQLESYLNIGKEDIFEKIKLCWASLFTARAIFYRFQKQLHQADISVAVVIQKMINPEISGVAFSVHPVTEDRNQIIIEAGYGLGEAIVSGEITPDAYVIEKGSRKIIDTHHSEQNKMLVRGKNGSCVWTEVPIINNSSQVLTQAQILELSEIVLAIENHFGFPCDIEWVYEAGKFYIVQSRPITTLS